MAKKAIAVLVFFFILLSTGCAGTDNNVVGYDDGYAQLRNKYYCDTLMDGYYNQAWKINLEDGSILTACPDPLCNHSVDSSCPFHSAIPWAIADGGRYMFYIGYGSQEFSIYCFDTETNATEKIYVYDKFPSTNPQFMYGEGRLFFDIPQLNASEDDPVVVEAMERTLLYYDIKTKEIKEYGDKHEKQRLLFEYKGKLYYRDGNTGLIYSTTGAFDDSEPLPLPDGAKINWYGDGYWPCGPGYIAKTLNPSDIYLFDENKSIPLPEEALNAILVGLIGTGDTFYCTLGSAAPADGENGRYIVKVCILNRDGSYRIYAVQSNYSFYVKKGYGDCVYCEVLSEYKDGKNLEGKPDPDNEETPSCSHLWIDLQSGKTKLYNTHTESILDTYLNDITVKTERIK